MTRLKRARWAGHVTCTGEMRNVYTILVGKSEWRIQFWKLRLRWEDSIKIDLKQCVRA
jgi:hypothetical protein